MNSSLNYVIFLEGPDDTRFLQKYFANEKINYFEYAVKKRSKVNDYIKSLKAMSNFDYYLLADSDGKSISEKKQDILNKYPCCEEEKIIIVSFEIESWYLAGLSTQNKEKLKIKKSYDSTNMLTKEFFKLSMPDTFDSRIDYMIEILKVFSNNIACQKNDSFDFFNKKMA